MSINTQFKLKDQKPNKDFIVWNEEMSKSFDQEFYYEHSHPVILWIEKMRLTTISSLIKKHMQENNHIDPVIVEVGCGTGQVLEEILRKIKTTNLIGIEPLDEWRQKTHKRIGNKARLLKGFAEDLPFENNSVDYIVCTEVLEHVIDPKIVLRELSRVLKKDGLIIVSIPNEPLINNLKEIIDSFKIYDKLFPKIQKHNDWHIHSLDLKSFKKFVPEGLKEQSLTIIPTFFLPLRYVIVFQLHNLQSQDLLKVSHTFQ
ncbi:MAG: class I SAM-dependent methyltransferase [Candidatus Melainabacteria bacterium]|nr:class I SAM-dependent methyltransferase [Candidatus Melainabacteria bacterium]